MTDILDTLKGLEDTHGDIIEKWLQQKRKEAAPYFYTSVDLRHSGLRLAPVDTNLYPAGFHNLSPAARDRASRFIARWLSEDYPNAKRVLIIPENHTRNLPYLENLATLLSLFETVGIEVKLGSLAAESPLTLETSSGKTITQYPLVRDGNKLVINGFVPDLIVLNNDMTLGVPPMLENVSQPIVPPPSMGWWQRRKSKHFEQYCALAEEFCTLVGLDPWLLCAEFHSCGRVDFKESVGLDCTARGIEQVLNRARKKHEQYGIKEEPYVFVKADSGTYGMGILTVRSPEEILDLNKKDRNKMQTIKEGARVSEVIIQEGIPTIGRVSGSPAEPMIYLIDGIPTGGMYRVNAQRDAYERLNAAGMEFVGMCDEMEDECGKWKSVDNCYFRAFGLVAAIAALAAGREKY